MERIETWSGLSGVLASLVVVSSCHAEAPGDASLVPAPGSPYAVGGEPADVKVGDVDGDGHADLVLVDVEGGAMVVLAGDGKGGFGGPRRIELPAGLQSGPHLLALGDLDGDGALDAAITAHDSNDVVLLRGSGSGAFAPFPGSPIASGFPPPAHNHGLALADVDGDGDLDLLLGNESQGALSALLGDGHGGFAPAPGSPFPVLARPYPFAVADLDDLRKDGHPDLAVPGLGGSEVALLRGVGDGTFAPFPGSPLATPPRPFYVAAADLDGPDGDGHLDLVISHDDSPRLSVFLGDGQGAFHRAPDAETAGGGWRFALADWNADGHPDLATGSRDATVRVLLGNGDGTFREGPALPAGQGTWTVTSADLNGDGKPDLLALGAEDGTVRAWLQR